MEKQNIPDNRIVLTLDAGGTNFVFSAIREAREIVEPETFPSHGDNLDLCLKTIIKGFESVRKKLPGEAAAISFAFPGPADYVNGIIGDLANLPSFRGGVALGDMLKDHFGIPVYINNDGDLFAYGEAIYGMLPEINRLLKDAGSNKEYRNLIGITLGTGFGCGLVRNSEPVIGDNGAAAEIWLVRNPLRENSFAEESISKRALLREYAAAGGTLSADMTPFDVYLVAKGSKPGNREAAYQSFKTFGTAIGIILSDVVNLMDACVVIGGGLANAWDLFVPAMLEQMRGSIRNFDGKSLPRALPKVYNLENAAEVPLFTGGEITRVKVPFSERTVAYDPMKRVGVGLSRLGTNTAVALGAYAFALKAGH